MIQFGIVKYGIVKTNDSKDKYCYNKGDELSSEDDEPSSPDSSMSLHGSVSATYHPDSSILHNSETFSDKKTDNDDVENNSSTTTNNTDILKNNSPALSPIVNGDILLQKYQDCSNNNEDDTNINNKIINTLKEKIMDTVITSDLSEMTGGSMIPNHVTLEALEHTKVAVAQFAATAIANGADETALKELAILQSTLFSLQHQQVLQMQLIQQLQSQLVPAAPIVKTNKEQIQHNQNESENNEEIKIEKNIIKENINDNKLLVEENENIKIPVVVHNRLLLENSIIKREITSPTTINESEKSENISNEIKISQTLNPTPSHSFSPSIITQTNRIPSPMKAPMCDISSSLASSIITYHDTPSSLDEPNTLEMLQKRAQEVLDSASQGLLSGNLVDELTFRSEKMSQFDSKGGSRSDSFFKHRCRYCGKVFGSDSALQIHVRSHTGERPFKCNVCGSSFTTKGNLKVHFTRHTQKFPPHMPMNMIPIPAEHMEKYHAAALLGQMPLPTLNGPIPQTTIPSSGGPFPSVSGFPGLPIYRPSQMDFFKPPNAMHHHHHHHHHHPHNHPTFFRNILNTNEQDTPADLSLSTKQLSQKENNFNQLEQIDRLSENNSNSITPEIDETFDIDSHQENASIQNSDTEEHFHQHRSTTPKNCINDDDVDDVDDDDDNDNKNENAEKINAYNNTENNEVNNIDNEIAIDKNHNNNNMLDDSKTSSIIESKIDVAKPLNLSEIRCRSHASSTSTNPSELMVNERDPSKNPAVYSTMLPRPGSNDSSWENLIEITKTSETSKLQEFVDNIENKLTDPNQCFMCHRVLSCRSSLQMHYRTHTGERPFRCRICGRAFTTKGNLKTHMGVHRIKPALRNLHQCPVCHKKYTNALVLQQHIKTHTGEPTDLTFDQIRAAEIRDFIPLPPGYFQSIGLNQYGGIEKSNEDDGNESESSIDDNEEFNEEKEEDVDDDNDVDDFNNEINTENFNDNDSVENLNHNSDEIISASHRIPLENQVQTITTMASQMSATADINILNSDNKMEFDKAKSFLNGNLYPITENKLPQKQNIPQFLNVLDLTANSHEKNSISIPITKQHINLYPNIPFLPHIPHSPTTPGSMDEVKQSLSLSKLSPSPTKTTETSSTLFSVEQRQQHQQQLHPPPLLQNNTLNSLANSILPTGPFNPFGLTGIRGNTTCNICFKTFACHSALEIHYRSHTKERPFKCTVCDRGFSTKGNMKQHMLTHKIRDMPQHMFGNSVPSSPSSDSDHSFVSHHSRENQILQHHQQQQQQHQQSHQHSQQIRSDSPVYYDNRLSKNLENGTTDELQFKEKEILSSHNQFLMEHHNRLEFGIKRSPPPSLEFEHSLPKRPLISPLNPSNRSSNIKVSINDADDDDNNNKHDDDHDDGDDDDDEANDDNQTNNNTTFLSPINLLDQRRITVTESINVIQPQRQQQSEISLSSSSPVSHNSSSPNDNDDSSINSKHLCSVCHKCFSSTSALQIHMRTHTGDKPFRCSICEKSFTTKGNLKVHMGIHMWSTTGFSRRGRRMSLELPLKHPLPLSQKDSEFLQRRPDLFYPYHHHHHLPTPYPNGIHSKFNGLSGISTDSNIHSIGMLPLPNISTNFNALQYPTPLYPQSSSSHQQNTTLVPISKNYPSSSQSFPINNIDKHFHSISSPISVNTRTIPIESNIKSIRIPNIREQQRQQQKQYDEQQPPKTLSEPNNSISSSSSSVHKMWMDLNYPNKSNFNSNNNGPSSEIIINKENLSTIKNISRIPPAIIKTSTHQQQEPVTVT